ncbi:MAG TPA: phosphotransferase [Stellaceae bacterium]
MNDLTDALRAMGLLAPGEEPRFTPLPGGVSSEIWRVDLRTGPVCIKRALAKLRVDRDWFAPVERWRYEHAWFRVAGAVVPKAVPRLLGSEPRHGLFAMEYLDPVRYPLWKAELHAGHADPGVAASVGRNLVAIHAATANDPRIAAEFASDAVFFAIRLDPYLGEVARRHPDLAPRLDELIATTATTRRALVHGDVSPKNILVGPEGPVFLDAECAWYGDPAFDLAFCLNHLLLKCRWTPFAAPAFLACFDALHAAYLAGVDWEATEAVERRAAHLLPGLLLARIDGKSPVEYITDAGEQARVRNLARALLVSQPSRLAPIRAAWAKEFGIA